ncbi:uncharacterized protein N0V89_012614 [Didymosphaeria variabile]|uniref:Uncharacterized protein n=1 Tax=Didymosphaeria variabile TaxID=1932322 RepID=A0A9W8XA95_9PLEO|nr:uncharacterized protein N0V89_012614 [Didymosphaeria variabile]KAJ4344870.1 hypothetical protein N0V89_012614 [Didymosphaeria variabile]
MYHMDTQFMQFSHQFQDFWNQRSREIVLHRLEHTSLLNDLAAEQTQNMHDHLVQFINEVSIDITNSFQHHVAGANQGHGTTEAPHPLVAEGSLNLFANDNQAHYTDAQGPLSLSSNPAVAPPHPGESLAELFEFMRTQGSDMAWAPPMIDFAGFDSQQLNPDDGNSEHGNHGVVGDSTAEPSESTGFPSEQIASDPGPEDDWDLVARYR